MTSLARPIRPRILGDRHQSSVCVLVLDLDFKTYIKLLHVLAGDSQRNVMIQRQGLQHNSTAHVFSSTKTASKVLRDESVGRASLALIAFDQLSTNLEAVWASSFCCPNLPCWVVHNCTCRCISFENSMPRCSLSSPSHWSISVLHGYRILILYLHLMTSYSMSLHVSQVILHSLGSLTPQQRRKDDRRVRGWNGLECEGVRKKKPGFVYDFKVFCALNRWSLYRSISFFILASPTLRKRSKRRMGRTW